jgi:hypothetical protein
MNKIGENFFKKMNALPMVQLLQLSAAGILILDILGYVLASNWMRGGDFIGYTMFFIIMIFSILSRPLILLGVAELIKRTA